MESAPLLVKIASEPWEFDEIHGLNHRTFAEEIPQHPATASGRLVDRFHPENIYIVALRGKVLAGMMVVRDRRPFSLDQRLPDLERYLPPGRSMCELRLLAVAPGERGGRVLRELLAFASGYCLGRGFDLALISAFTRQLKLYRHLGFEAFGPLVGTIEVPFQPMMLTLERFAPLAPLLKTGTGVVS